MYFRKGVFKKLYLVLILVFLLTGVNVAYSAECANPAVAKDVGVGGICSINDEDECCPDDDSYYDSDNDYYPDDREDCLESFFGENMENCEVACCFYGEGEERCQDVRTVACVAEDGTPDPDGNSCTETELDECEEGCCCYDDVGADGALISTETYCEDSMQGDFHPGMSDVEECNTECEHDPSTGEGVVDPVDIDDDIEPGVSCPSDMYICPSWASEESLDGYCCCDSADVVCGPDEYCCEGSCYEVPCEEACESHKPALDEDGVQMRDEDGCWMVYECQPDGTFADEPSSTEDCVVGFEVCHSDSDDTGDGLMNCQDPFCQGQRCADDSDHRYDGDDDFDRCMEKGYWDHNDQVYRCCGDADRLNDCSDAVDGYDTCGPCDCLKIRTSPILHEIGVERGTNEVEVKWSHGCEGEITYSVMRCDGDDCPEEPSTEYFERKEKDSSPFIDKGIEENTRYCYYVKSNYPGDYVKRSQVECFTSGDKQCMETELDEFCLDEDYDFGSELVLRARCFSNNTLAIRNNCGPGDDVDSKDWDWPYQICKGPDRDGNTECVYQDDCEKCGEPFRTFADYETSVIEQDEGFSPQNLCQYLDNCFYDYSPTSRDYFRMCQDVRTCHDYRSEFACSGQPSSELESNNPCLPRNCTWKELESGGVCLEETSAYNTCDRCERTVFGGVFDVCDSEKCSSFGNCFLRPSDYQCISGEHVTCWNYVDRQQCEGGRELYIDVEYDNGDRIGGTHEIINESGDQMGIGLCRWYDQGGGDGFCYKDADFSGEPDDQALKLATDYIAPETKIITPSLSRDLNISFQVTDFDERGFHGSGVDKSNIYFCKVEEGEEPCYPENKITDWDHSFDGSRGWVDLGGAVTGKYTLYYYSKDRANNLEKIQNQTIGIDRTKPNITIEYIIHTDTQNYDESNVTFVISTDKYAECTDEFRRGDETWTRELTGGYEARDWLTIYEGLSDGYYQYRVECVDEAGNTNFKEINDIRVEADQFITNPSPSGIIDYSDVTLKVSTEMNTTCRFSEKDEHFEQMRNTFNPGDRDERGYYVNYYDYELEDGSGTYSFHVKCQGEGDRISSDGILFVYDVLPPETKVIDHLDNPINFSAYYSGNNILNSVFLECEDSPRYGFGCDKTFYCTDEKDEDGTGPQECSPEEEITYENPIELPGIEDDFMLCYYSVEKTIDGMGGLEESIQCNEFMLDTHEPYIEVESDIRVRTDPDDPKITSDLVVDVSGKVIDPDTMTDMDNKLTIVVDHKESGNETRYEDIPANPDFSEMVELEEGMNEIRLSAVDRSGQTSGVDRYFVYNEPYDGEWIELVRPAHGVASSEVFTFEVGTPHLDADDCRYTFAESAEPNEEFDIVKKRDGSDIHRKNNMDFSSQDAGNIVPIRVKCEFGHNIPSAERKFELKYLTRSPRITDISIDRGLGNRDPPIIVEHPLETNLIVETDQKTICKYTQDSSIGYNSPDQNFFSGYEERDYSETSTVFLSNLEDNEEHTYYVQCENAVADDDNIRVSGQEVFTFRVDTDFDPLIERVEPESPSPEGVFQIKIETTKAADYCEFIDGPSTPDMDGSDNYNFESAEVDLESGEHKFEIECYTHSDGLESDNFVIVVQRDPPGKPTIYGGNETINKYAMSASWSVHEESFADIILYEYGIGSSPGGTDVLEWQNTTDRSVVAADLNLTEGQPYYWKVRAMDEFERWGEANVSGAVYVSPAEEEIDCSDYENKENCEKHDVCSWDDESEECLRYEPCNTGTVSEEFNETDVDCGGPNCPPCDAGQNCNVDDDCLSGVCEDGVCQEPSCTDGVKNQGESDVDCGGPNCPRCELGKDCVRDSDCISGYCDNGVCEEPPETHVDCSDLDEGECIDDETCIWDDENETCEDLVCSELEMDECEESDLCEWDDETLSCTEKTEGCIVEEGPMQGYVDSNCNGIPDAWKEQYAEYKSLMEEYGVDDASDLDFSGDGKTNLEAYLEGIHPIHPEEVEEEPSYWLLILLLILLILILLILIYIGYFKYYDRIPPNIRYYTDKVMLPLRRFVNKAKMKLLEIEDKILELMGQKPRNTRQQGYAKQGQRTQGGQPPGIQGTRPGQQMPPTAASRGGIPEGRGGPVQAKSNVKGGPQPPTPKRAVITDRDVENAETTKEMVEKIRKKRQEEKEKQRKQLLDKFNTGEVKKTDVKKKSLLEKVNDTFDSEKGKEKENDKKKQ